MRQSHGALAIGLSLADWCCAGRANPRGWAGTAGGRDTRWLANLADLSDRLLGLRLSDLKELSRVGLSTAGPSALAATKTFPKKISLLSESRSQWGYLQ